ncbi:LysR family transcriptional regulator [Aeromicrobium sp. YIM 150415]|uniref:LysR substrate-binding domain-containing protein n=1 Tax=Aeromicrobium sp. YIM 150415 TaxID=2803912 RepID=UPI001965F2B6|nr:LysR family transcriptional regulator [Aeromicrobium sp. YIM 150415]MBM9464263.1 LysR family transcriptional regulator [Aeromicrobium sp. YIM 150415]
MASDFTFHQLRSFVAVAEEGSYRRAAERLNISQPPLSRQVGSLERSLGTELFERTGRGISLTAAGEVFLIEASALIASADRARNLARDAHLGRVGSIRVGYAEPAAFDVLPHVLGRFREAYPRVDLELHEMHSHEAVRQLEQRTIDVAYLRPPIDSLQVALTMLHPDPLMAVVPQFFEHAETEILLSELRDQPFVTYAPGMGAGISSSTLQACAAAGFSPRINHTATSTPMLMSLVAGGGGVALVSHQFSQIPYLGVRFIGLRDDRAESYLAFGTRVGETLPSIRQLREISLDVSRDLYPAAHREDG